MSDVDYLDTHFATGVGQNDAEWDYIQAEWYMKSSGIEKRECPLGGFEMQEIKNGATLLYPNMANLQEQKSIQFHVVSSSG